MDLMTPESGTIVWTIITFVLLSLILYKIAWKPILNMLDEREQRITESLQSADKAREEAEKHADERQQVIEEARKEAHEIIAAARQSAETVREDIIAQSKVEADKLIERAKNEIEMSRDKVLHDMRALAVELSMNATEKLIKKNLSEKDHDEMIRAAMDRMEQLN
jgi:F-type H+-transporting ATPase subunit b